MTDGFDRSVLILMLHLIAGHHTYIFKELHHHYIDRGGGNRTKLIEIMSGKSGEHVNYFNDQEKAVLRSLQQLVAASRG
jgi:hypothetical protein